ncbi:fumarylacetoacetate hydrolase family protein [Vibrio cortegadensis]|uniref:Fumarylacetoacetate hydrolase family protein n=1 Tax=Vibrio cortegadensis TaxID=1328770 RepID=A0ABV4M2T9_9VIBR
MNAVRVGEREIIPTKIVCIGRNYVDHIKELNNPIPEQMVVFNKPNNCVTSTLSSFHQEPLHYEAEICFLVEQGRLSAVGIGLDLTKRNLQSYLKNKGLPWERAKAFDGSAVMSRFISLDHIDVKTLQIELYINCVRVQCGQVEQMLYPPRAILAELETYTTLYDGDIIMSGTPKGVGEVHAGDVFLGRLKSGDKTLIEIEWQAK